MKRYRDEGLEGLKDKPKVGRRPEISVEVEYWIKTILMESNIGWSTKQVEKLTIQESGTGYHHNHIYRIVRKWGFKQKVPRKVQVNTHLQKRKRISKKDQRDTCGYAMSTERVYHGING